MNDSYIIYMKAGPYCGYSLDEIEAIKLNEIRQCNRFYWGYGGVFCHPKRIIPFVEQALESAKAPTVYFSITKSEFSSPIGGCREWSSDGIDWELLHKDVILVGNQYALVCTNLQRVSLTLNLSDYKSVLGDKLGKSLDDYIKYRVDKACAVYAPDPARAPKVINIAYTSELIPPYCVYVR